MLTARSGSEADADHVAIDPQVFRRVLGQFPAGVVAITAMSPTGPLAMTVGSFTSVSLDPPLVAFFPSKTSKTWPRIREVGSFCVNVLAAQQESLCRSFAISDADKFSGVDWQPSPSGSPRLEEVMAWIDCDIEAVHPGGDHDIVVGRVRSLDVGEAALPLLFFQGGYGRFAPLSFAARSEPDLVEHLRLVDLARPEMEQIAEATGVECLAIVLAQDELVIAARSGEPSGGRPPTRVGQRIPFVAPLGAAFAAWDEDVAARWIRSATSGPGAPPETRARRHYEDMLVRVRERGWSLGLGSAAHRELEIALRRTSVAALTPGSLREVHSIIDSLGDEFEPETIVSEGRSTLRSISVPVFDSRQAVVMELCLYGLPRVSTESDLNLYRAELMHGAEAVNHALTGT